ncbi:DUF1990 domain-containing protein [Streptomyces sp. NBC_00178]|uniref:DUF1990 family protein n=1 Tax=Streptomyces sp. NBC_00178 TaxID=2975672 RepID=UPI002E2E6B39|nr:DUF1990 domain-containing protein [Streptomyces sp. NBC_00178]
MSPERSDGPGRTPLTYAPAGATRPGDPEWRDAVPGFRRFETTVDIGRGDDDWRAASEAVLRWGVKRRSGFAVAPSAGADGAKPPTGAGDADDEVAEGAEYRITAGWRRLAVHEPVRIVAVVDTADTRGFAYGTLPGHPVSGEEAFVVRRGPGGRVTLTLRSLTAPAPAGVWRRLFPLLLVAQRVFRVRYRRALLRSARRAD